MNASTWPARVAGTEDDAAGRINPAGGYFVRYVTNLRTGAGYNLAYVSGTTAREMLAASAEPARLVFLSTAGGAQ